VLEKEEALKGGEARLHDIEKLAKVAGWERDSVSGAVILTPELYTLLGVDIGEPPTLERFDACVHSEDREIAKLALADALAN
jgi:hypothetical protein